MSRTCSIPVWDTVMGADSLQVAATLAPGRRTYASKAVRLPQPLFGRQARDRVLSVRLCLRVQYTSVSYYFAGWLHLLVLGDNDLYTCTRTSCTVLRAGSTKASPETWAVGVSSALLSETASVSYVRAELWYRIGVVAG